MDNVFSQAVMVNLNMTLMAAIFVVLIFRPDRIANLQLLKFGCVLFAISLCAPVLSQFSTSDPQPTNKMVLQLFPNTIGSRFSALVQFGTFVAAFLMSVFALMPRSD